MHDQLVRPKPLLAQKGLQYNPHKALTWLGSGCGSIGKAVASDTRGMRFETSHCQNLYWTLVFCQMYWKDENKEKRGREWPNNFLQKSIDLIKLDHLRPLVQRSEVNQLNGVSAFRSRLFSLDLEGWPLGCWSPRPDRRLRIFFQRRVCEDPRLEGGLVDLLWLRKRLKRH